MIKGLSVSALSPLLWLPDFCHFFPPSSPSLPCVKQGLEATSELRRVVAIRLSIICSYNPTHHYNFACPSVKIYLGMNNPPPPQFLFSVRLNILAWFHRIGCQVEGRRGGEVWERRRGC